MRKCVFHFCFYTFWSSVAVLQRFFPFFNLIFVSIKRVMVGKTAKRKWSYCACVNYMSNGKPLLVYFFRYFFILPMKYFFNFLFVFVDFRLKQLLQEMKSFPLWNKICKIFVIGEKLFLRVSWSKQVIYMEMSVANFFLQLLVVLAGIQALDFWFSKIIQKPNSVTF